MSSVNDGPVSAQLFRAAIVALAAEEQDEDYAPEDDALLESLQEFNQETPLAKYKHLLIMPRHDKLPQAIFGIVDIVATSAPNDDLGGARTIVAAAEQISPKEALTPRSGNAPKPVALKITVIPARSKLSGTFLDGMRDIAGEFKNAAKITKKHGVSNMFVNAHDGAYPSWFLYNNHLQVAFSWSMDFCKGGTLNNFNDWLAEQKWMNEEELIACMLPIIYGLLTALKQLHSLRLGHRDLHEGNVLFDHEGVLNIGDFGRAKKKVQNTKIELDQTVYGEKNVPPPESTHPHPSTLSTFTDEAYYDPLGVDLWSVGTLISDMLCPAHKQLKWPTEEQIANTKRPKLIQLCVESRKAQVRKYWTPAMKKILDGRLMQWTLNAFRSDTKGFTITDQDIKYLFKNQKVEDSVFKVVWKYYYDVKRRELDPFLTAEQKVEAARRRAEASKAPPNLREPLAKASPKSKSPNSKQSQSNLPIEPPPMRKLLEIPDDSESGDSDESGEQERLPLKKRKTAPTNPPGPPNKRMRL